MVLKILTLQMLFVRLSVFFLLASRTIPVTKRNALRQNAHKLTVDNME